MIQVIHAKILLRQEKQNGMIIGVKSMIANIMKVNTMPDRLFNQIRLHPVIGVNLI